MYPAAFTIAVIRSAFSPLYLCDSIGPPETNTAGNIQPHRRHQHTGRYLIAITDTHHSVGLMSIYHILDTIGNQIPGRQRIKHTIMSHSDTIVDRYGIELGCETTEFFDFGLNNLTDFMQMYMPGYKLCK